MRGKTISAEQVWKSPDGSRKIYEVSIEADGKVYTLQTYSDKISKVGFEGELETYDKDGNRFVRQKTKEGGGNYGGGNRGGSPRNDEATQESIARSVALKAAVDMVSSRGSHTKADDQKYTIQLAEHYLSWLQGSSTATAQASTSSSFNAAEDFNKKYAGDTGREFEHAPLPDYPGEEPVNLDDIPF
jgi:hypothetical protein